MEEKVEKVLEEIRPMLALHAGNIELAGIEQGVVRVRFLGTCQGCPLSSLTLKAGVEEVLCERIPEITAVEAI